jgi:hypothetical protein
VLRRQRRDARALLLDPGGAAVAKHGKELFYRQAELAYEAATETTGCNMMDATALEGVQAFIDNGQQALGVSH